MEKELFNLVRKKKTDKRILVLFVKPPDFFHESPDFPSSSRGLAGLLAVVLDSSDKLEWTWVSTILFRLVLRSIRLEFTRNEKRLLQCK